MMLSPAKSPRKPLDVTADWFWEGNVVKAIVHFLEGQGWSIMAGVADIETKAQGVDLRAAKDDRVLLVEPKAFLLSTTATRAELAKSSPRTQPTKRNGFSHALLKAMRLQTKYPPAVVAIAFPDFPRYRRLFEETRSGLAKLGVAFITVSATGDVVTWGM